MNQIYIFIIIIILIIMINIIYSYSTYFTKTIKIKSADFVRNSKYGLNIIADTNNNIYVVHNSLFYGFFEATELYKKIEIGKTYKITGFGLRIPILNMYPNIISGEET
jgi:hypothetical protein